MPEQVLKIAGHVPYPETVAIAALVLAIVAFVVQFRLKRRIAGSLAGIAILALGLTPLAASHILHVRNVYHIQVFLVRPDKTPIYYAQLKSTPVDDLQISEGGWRLDIPPQFRPADGKVTFSAEVKDEFLKGNSMFILAGDYYPTVTIPLVADTSAKVRGVVVDEGMAAVFGAAVSVAGYPDVVLTDKHGNFSLPAHAGNGQLVEVRAEKDGIMTRMNAPAGKAIEVILGSE
ncbi:MAG: hypothetical protein WAL71_09355 [Terriglobales bacterium]|jgi:hypothetical protein